jgi:hypothetical protein
MANLDRDMSGGRHRVKVVLGSQTKYERVSGGVYIIHINADSASAANEPLRQFIAKELHKLPSKVSITSGRAGTDKVVEVY